MRGGAAIRRAFKRAKKEGRLAFIPYFTAGFPSTSTFKEVFDFLLEKGDVVELGVPFSDPLADGPTIQRSSQLALESGVGIAQILSWVREARKRFQTPVVLMSYFNPILRYGLEKFSDEAREAGIDGVIIPDLPVEEARDWLKISRGSLATVFLAAPTTGEERIKILARKSRGFLYCVSVTGVTGERKDLPPYLFDFLKRARRVSELPLAVGFGISRKKQVEQLKTCADGIVVGSALIRPFLCKNFKEAWGDFESIVEELRSSLFIT